MDIEVRAVSHYRRIRELREDHDMTQRQLAALLRMPQSQYFRYEQGYRDIPCGLLLLRADLYGTSTDYILERTDDPGPPAGRKEKKERGPG